MFKLPLELCTAIRQVTLNRHLCNVKQRVVIKVLSIEYAAGLRSSTVYKEINIPDALHYAKTKVRQKGLPVCMNNVNHLSIRRVDSHLFIPSLKKWLRWV